MNRKDTARYMLATLGARWSVIILGGVALAVLMYAKVISESAGVPLLAMLLGGAGFTALGTTPPPAAPDPVVEPVPHQRIAATLEPQTEESAHAAPAATPPVWGRPQ